MDGEIFGQRISYLPGFPTQNRGLRFMPFVEVTYSIAAGSTCDVAPSSRHLVGVEICDTSTLDSGSRIA